MKKLIFALLFICSFGAQAQVIRPLSVTTIAALTIDTLYVTYIVGVDSIITTNRAYNATTWNNSLAVPTMNSLRDKFAALDANYTLDTAKFVRLGGRAGGQTLAQKITFSFDSTLVFDHAFNATTWNNSTAVPTKNAIRDQLILKAALAGPTFTGTVTGGDSVLVVNESFNATTWNNSTAAPTKNAIRDELILKSTIGAAETITGVKKFTGHNLYTGEITTATDTLALATVTHYTVLADASSSAILLTLPNAAVNEGTIFRIKCINAASEVKIITAGGDIDGTAGATGITLSVWDGREFMSNGTNWYIISKF